MRFYRALGLEPFTRTQMKDGTRIVWMRDPLSGQILELFQLSPKSPLFRPFRRHVGTDRALIFSTSDVGAVLPRLRRMGAKVEVEFEEGDVQFSFLRDPDGTWVELLGWTDATRTAHRQPPLMSLLTTPADRRRLGR